MNNVNVLVCEGQKVKVIVSGGRTESASYVEKCGDVRPTRCAEKLPARN